MNESEWLTSEDPEAMLVWLSGRESWTIPPPVSVSDRKLWLFDDAVHDDTAPYEKAALLREIVGNPYRPVTLLWTRCLPCGGSGSCGHTASPPEDDTRCQHCSFLGYPSGRVPLVSWLTPTVLSLAQAAYDEWSCRECGPLDHFRLALVADALEEAGCGYYFDQQLLLWHLRGLETCPRCQGKKAMTLTQWAEAGEPESNACLACKCEGLIPSPGPHVRGCWVLDLILGIED